MWAVTVLAILVEVNQLYIFLWHDILKLGKLLERSTSKMIGSDINLGSFRINDSA
jgi:hypothetical protein